MNKLAPRAHIGYLVGYDSTNIFRIYIPNQKKVIRTRDVKFNEQLLYDDSQPDLANVLRVRTDQILKIINARQIQNLQDELESSSGESNETLDEIRVDTEERRLVESCRPGSDFLTTIVLLSVDLDRLYELCLSCLSTYD